MRAQVGDRIILAAEHIDQPTRDGEVLEVRGADGGPPFFVRWSDGHTGLIYPGPGAILKIGTAEHEAPAPPAAAPVPTGVPVTAGTPATPPPATTHATAPGHTREWNIRVTIFESGDDTSATVVLLADAPEHLSARGTSHRSAEDNAVPEIGDEVAVARALRHLADQLLHVAEQDIEDLTGEDAHVRPV
ncbi:hypothetical protein N865_13575 [Intrasporangium oryzae NRRL B-24470]|uniref:DUF1918 domain-containing protein n=1 Tax=Intrasporangium oryzae NRRL B-24470 TaxID=1386089 RepID=W9G7H4_9MICO|nr:dsRBD fold-containing protein [Intrasporangium oryzae]EWT00768.1 hypothetical protein N865_13575 [Intrasporangium oryzae NRRL B-24470]